MVINCLSCGKTVSSNLHNCPYCHCQVTDITLQMNGRLPEDSLKRRIKEIVIAFRAGRQKTLTR